MTSFLLAYLLLQGIAIFLAGNVLQYHSHALLANLTTTRGGKINKSSSAPPKYRIPRGGAFELVSCPHYFAEIVIYVGLALILTGVNTKPWLMAIWVVSVPRHHLCELYVLALNVCWCRLCWVFRV